MLVESELKASLREYARYLAANGLDPKDVDWDKVREDARPGAERRVREYLVLDAVARREEITITETELDAEIKRAAARRGRRDLGAARAGWRRTTGWTPFATRCGSPGRSTS